MFIHVTEDVVAVPTLQAVFTIKQNSAPAILLAFETFYAMQ